MNSSNKASRDIYSVSRLNAEIRAVLEGSFPLLWVEGEISNLSTPRSGHSYFSLKDSHAQVRCALFRGKRQLLRFQPDDGDQVLMRARISLYEARGDFQLIVEHMESAGAGALQRAFDALKAKLDKEGLFDTSRKRPLPAYARRIGIITSATGAAVRDILQVLQRRFPALPVLIYPVPVQGQNASEEISQALKLADQRKDCDLLILARGGGSLEDLAAFNDEKLARTIAALKIPIISAIGHEIDFTIADFVADRRAPTPSAAAELATIDQQVLQDSLQQQQKRLLRSIYQQLHQEKTLLTHLVQKLQLLHPLGKLEQQQQRLDELSLKLEQRFGNMLLSQEHRLDKLSARLILYSPMHRLKQMSARLKTCGQRLGYLSQTLLSKKQMHLAALSRELNAISPLQTLGRGYSITQISITGEILRSSKQVQAGDKITTRLADGELVSVVDKS
jgi:exodeoxyribonuclease VII large subunit